MKHRNEYYNQHKLDVYVDPYPDNNNDTYETQRVDNRAPDCIETDNHVDRFWYNGRLYWAYYKGYGYDLYDTTGWAD
eukprot:SAG22_NODE_10052_length_555_cov_8.289474_2_plen_76_part_01